MAELIALLLATLNGVMTSGADAATLAAAIEVAVEKEQPAVIEAVTVNCSGVRPAGVKEITLSLEGLLLDPLLIETAEIRFSDLQQQSDGSLALGAISWDAQISDDELTAALRKHVDSLHDATISIDENALRLTGSYPVLRMKLPFEVAGHLLVQDETQLVFLVEQSGVSGVQMPGRLNRLIETEINPVYDLAEFAERNEGEIAAAKQQLSYEFKLSIDSITNGAGHIIVAGKA